MDSPVTKRKQAPPLSPVSAKQADLSFNSSFKEDSKENATSPVHRMEKKKSTDKPVLSHVYKVISKHHGLAYGTPNSPIYGENNRSSMTRAFQAMELGEVLDGGATKTVFCDVGSGTGAPSLHAACEYPNLLSYGFELMGYVYSYIFPLPRTNQCHRSRWWISQTILNDVLRSKVTSELGSRTMLAHVDLGDLKDFGPCTHVFAFDTGFPLCALEMFARAFNASKHIRVLGSFHKESVLVKAGFKDLELKCKVKMTMSGSSEGKQLLVYTRNRVATTDEPQAEYWNLTKLCPPPTKSEYQPTVEHGASYAMGEEERQKGPKAYQIWVQDQIGFARQASVGVRTRSSFKKSH